MKLTDAFEFQVRRFINAGSGLTSRTEEIKNHQLCVYMRMFKRYLGTDLPLVLIPTLEIARVGVLPQYQGRGLYRQFLNICEEYNDRYALYVESVLDKEQHGIYERRGFVLVPMYSTFARECPRSFYKPLKEEI
jgi:GNAT superfamily N-acetyltransferase